MKRLLAFLLLLGALTILPATAFAQDDDPTVLVVEDAQLPANTENPPEAVDDLDQLDTLTSIEYWHGLAILLPALIGYGGNLIGTTSATSKARLSVGVYFGYAVIGEFLKGTFDSLTLDTPQLVMASVIKIMFISYTSYKVISNAAPSLVGGKPGPTA